MGSEANPSYLYSVYDVPAKKTIAEFEELTGGEMKVAMMPYTSVDKNGVAVTKFVPGASSYSPITLVHALNVEGQALNDWFVLASQGKTKDARKNINITMLSYDSRQPMVVWDITNALPVSISGFSFNQHTKGGLYYVCQELTIQPEFIEMHFK
jgi:phage tail-like protein